MISSLSPSALLQHPELGHLHLLLLVHVQTLYLLRQQQNTLLVVIDIQVSIWCLPACDALDAPVIVLVVACLSHVVILLDIHADASLLAQLVMDHLLQIKRAIFYDKIAVILLIEVVVPCRPLV